MSRRELASLRRGEALPGSRSGPVGVVFAEDAVLLAETLDHLQALGFATILLIGAPDALASPRDGVMEFGDPCPTRADVAAALTWLNRQLAGRWLFWCFNAEFLYFPFSNSRRIGDLVGFMEEERRASVHCCAVDLYAADLARNPDGVSLDEACFDDTGYYSYQTWGDGQPLDRQIDVFGGLAWRFEEHVPWTRRKLNRISLYQAREGLAMTEDFRLDDAEMNTAACQWHRNVTAALASFRVAKALRRNPDSASAISGFTWARSQRFDWTPQQLLDAGFMEPGQWF